MFFFLSLSLSLSLLSLFYKFKFQLIDKEKTQMLALLWRKFVTGQYLSVHSDESETSDLFSPRFIVSGPSARVSRGEALEALKSVGLSARPRDILRFKSCANFEVSVLCFHRRASRPTLFLSVGSSSFLWPCFPNRSRIDERNDAVDARQKGGIHNPPCPTRLFPRPSTHIADIHCCTLGPLTKHRVKCAANFSSHGKRSGRRTGSGDMHELNRKIRSSAAATF